MYLTRLSLNVAYASVNVEDVDCHNEIAECTYAKQNLLGSPLDQFKPPIIDSWG